MKTLALEINRKKWGRGVNGGSLLDQNGLMCCLGFACLKDGFYKKAIFNQGMPSNVVTKPTKKGGILERLLNKKLKDTRLCSTLAKTNDSVITTDKKKESRITELFRRINVKVKFTN